MPSLKQIKNEIIQAANKHLHAKTAQEALSHFTKDLIAVSNDEVFYSFDDLEKDVDDYYKNLKKVNSAKWVDVHVKLLNRNNGIFTAKFNYTFTDKTNNITKLNGVWTAIFVKKDNDWKICLRHETFSVK